MPEIDLSNSAEVRLAKLRCVLDGWNKELVQDMAGDKISYADFSASRTINLQTIAICDAGLAAAAQVDSDKALTAALVGLAVNYSHFADSQKNSIDRIMEIGNQELAKRMRPGFLRRVWKAIW